MNRISLSKSLCLNKDKNKGDIITPDDIDFCYGGRGLQPSEARQIIGQRLQRNLRKGQKIEEIDLSRSNTTNQSLNSPIVLGQCISGIPVRYHDALSLSENIKTHFLEFHLSYKDLDLNLDTIKSLINGINCSQPHTFHAPDFYRNELIFDPFSSCDSTANQSKAQFTNFLDHISSIISDIFAYSSEHYKVVVSFSHSSLTESIHQDDKRNLYSELDKFISFYEKQYPHLTLLPQTLPRNAWYLGGRRFVNMMCHPAEILDFCIKFNRKICLDTAHTIMACNSYNLNSEYHIDKLLDHTDHIHLVDARGETDEGLEFGKGELNLDKVLMKMRNIKESSFIPEIWQGHHNNGEGFANALNQIKVKKNDW